MTDSSFSLSSLIPAGMGNKVALTKDLEQRQQRELALLRGMQHTGTYDGWIYAGPADYTLREGRYYPARVLPDEYDHLIGPPTECHPNSLLAALSTGLRYFTGYYLVGQTVGHHSWCMDDDGIVELTYPTKGVPPDTVVSPEHGSSIRVPYTTPERWAYYGLEFDPKFVFSVVEDFGGTLPLLENDSLVHAQAMSHRYSVHGWPLT